MFFTVYLISVPIFFLIDMLWLGVIARNFYRSQLGHMLGDVKWTVAIIFYLTYLVGLTYFAIVPAIEQGSVGTAALLGALFGFFTYATYDLTNLSTLKGWPVLVSLVDIAWGTVLGASVACGTYLVYTNFIM